MHAESYRNINAGCQFKEQKDQKKNKNNEYNRGNSQIKLAMGGTCGQKAIEEHLDYLDRDPGKVNEKWVGQ